VSCAARRATVTERFAATLLYGVVFGLSLVTAGLVARVMVELLGAGWEAGPVVMEWISKS